MSGSGGGGGGGIGEMGGGGGSPGQSKCENLLFRTTLNSPVAKVIAKLKKDDALDIFATDPNKGPAKVVTSAGEVAGSITATQLARLLECMSEGYEYIALVLKVNGGQVEVEVRIKSK